MAATTAEHKTIGMLHFRGIAPGQISFVSLVGTDTRLDICTDCTVLGLVSVLTWARCLHKVPGCLINASGELGCAALHQVQQAS